MSTALREPAGAYRAASGPDSGLEEAEVTALWLLGRVPAAALPWPLLRAGRAGRGPGPDVREAAFRLPSGVVRAGDVEVHLRASDFVTHGHAIDPAYAGVLLHLVWEDDRPSEVRGTPTPLPGGGAAVTVALAPLLRDAARVRALTALGPSGSEPCARAAEVLGADAVATRVRQEGRRRLAERTWRAWRLADREGWDGAFRLLLDRALAGSAGRRAESAETRAGRIAALEAALGAAPLAVLAALARDQATPAAVLRALEPLGLGRGRAVEAGWNAVLPLLAALAAAYDDRELARATARLAEAWPSPRPYGRTRALQRLLALSPTAGGALQAQGLLHLQDLWCTRGGCGQCPVTRRDEVARRDRRGLPPSGTDSRAEAVGDVPLPPGDGSSG
ncbi:MAG: hypothetical protein AMXMBFR23_12950 [Chloroflexota bacterium]